MKVPNDVLLELELIRSSGAVNMLDTSTVIRYAEEHKLKNAAVWVQSNKVLYWDGVLGGFETK